MLDLLVDKQTSILLLFSRQSASTEYNGTATTTLSCSILHNGRVWILDQQILACKSTCIQTTVQSVDSFPVHSNNTGLPGGHTVMMVWGKRVGCRRIRVLDLEDSNVSCWVIVCQSVQWIHSCYCRPAIEYPNTRLSGLILCIINIYS